MYESSRRAVRRATDNPDDGEGTDHRQDADTEGHSADNTPSERIANNITSGDPTLKTKGEINRGHQPARNKTEQVQM